MTRLQGITATAEERVGEEETGADINRFQQLVENLWNPPKPLPTRKQYEARRKEQMEVESWAGAMTAERFLQLYPDPREYFTGTDRNKVATLGYTEHALADLLKRFPYQRLANVEGALRRLKLYIPTAEYLQIQSDSRKNCRSN